MLPPTAPDNDKVDAMARITDAMKVFDRSGKLVGTVDGTYGGAQSDAMPRTASVLAVPAPVPMNGEQTAPVVKQVAGQVKVPVFDETLDPDDDFPRELRERLRHDGFIRIDAGFLRHHRYALRSQIDHVASGAVALNVLSGDLIKH